MIKVVSVEQGINTELTIFTICKEFQIQPISFPIPKYYSLSGNQIKESVGQRIEPEKNYSFPKTKHVFSSNSQQTWQSAITPPALKPHF